MLTTPFLYLAIWYHNWVGLGIVILWVIINLVVFPKPKKVNSWFSKVVLGEKVWLSKFKSEPQLDLAAILNILTAVIIFRIYKRVSTNALLCIFNARF